MGRTFGTVCIFLHNSPRQLSLSANNTPVLPLHSSAQKGPGCDWIACTAGAVGRLYIIWTVSSGSESFGRADIFTSLRCLRLCGVYLPRYNDLHKFVSVEIGDLKPDHVLWHGDNGRKPWENRRQDPLGSISGRQLGDAVHRLAANSLKLRANPNETIFGHFNPMKIKKRTRRRKKEERKKEGRSSDMIPTVDPIISMKRDSYNNRSNPQHERNNRSTAQHREQHHTEGYYLPRFQQNGGNMHHYPHHVVHTQIPPGAHFHQQDGGYTNTYGCYQPYGAAGSHHLSGSWAP
ncbi:hypothetical protein CsSME_00048532 [Camellia sinensis var. sinensis]